MQFLRKDKNILISAHRGTFGGNIIQNTIPAFENALNQGADILEIDIAQTINGDFFCFHTGLEAQLFGSAQNFEDMTTQEVLKCKLYNVIGEPTSQKLDLLNDVLDHFKDKCLINIDRGWPYWLDVIKLLNDRKMYDQILLKSPPTDALLTLLSENGHSIMYMPITRTADILQKIQKFKTRTHIVEVIFHNDTSDIAQPTFIKEMHNQRVLVWVNAITLNEAVILSGGHDDNRSLLGDMNDGWGWLVDQGFDIIQTDWPALLKNYTNSRYTRFAFK